MPLYIRQPHSILYQRMRCNPMYNLDRSVRFRLTIKRATNLIRLSNGEYNNKIEEKHACNVYARIPYAMIVPMFGTISNLTLFCIIGETGFPKLHKAK